MDQAMDKQQILNFFVICKKNIKSDFELTFNRKQNTSDDELQ